MKPTFLILILGVFQATAQTQPAAPTAPSGALPASPTTPGLPASPATPGLPASPTVSGVTGFTNAGGLFSATNQFGTNLLPADLGPLLADLQVNLQQLLPLLASVNNNFASFTLPGATPTGASAAVPITGANLSGNSSADVSSSRGVNQSANLSTPVGGGTLPLAPATTALGNNAAAGSLFPPSATGATNAIGLPPGTFAGAAGTNFFMNPAALNALNALIILQNDVQRMLPVVAGLTGGGLDLSSLTPTNRVGGAATNRLVPATSGRLLNPATGQSRTPTSTTRQ